MKYVDYVQITCIAGKGGDGIIAFNHFPNNYYGGPCGGNGGKGGNIYIKGSINTHTLLDINLKKIYQSENGKDGGVNNRQGRAGKDLVLDVPIGSLVVDSKTQEVICDLINDKEKFLIVKGGIGGHGNSFFKTETHRAPYLCENGESGEIKKITIELKSLADVALIGFPNSGKSTLFKTITGTNVRVAPYEFTTLIPNISYKYINERKIFFVDIPGIIKDAHLGKGLGFTFLRHAERANFLIILLDGNLEPEEILNQYYEINRELNLFSSRLKNIKRKIFISKLDNISLDKFNLIKNIFSFFNDSEKPIFISALRKINMDIFFNIIYKEISGLEIFSWKPANSFLVDINSYFDKIEVKRVTKHHWLLSSKRLNYWVYRIPYQLSTENRKRLERKILNIIKRAELTKHYNFKNNDVIQVKDFQFSYYEETI